MIKLALLVALLLPAVAAADPAPYTTLNTSRATFKTEAPLETIVGTVGSPSGTPYEQLSVQAKINVDPVKPQDAKGSEANRYAVFEIKNVEVAGPLPPGKETPAKVRGTFTVRGKPYETVADALITYIKLTPEQVEAQKRFNFAAENLRVKAKFATKFTNHNMQVPQILILKVSDDIQVETDLILVRH
ncbi:MAG: hypothetical protein ACREOH_07330 [Candidatus Entotheonellia bacterium]